MNTLKRRSTFFAERINTHRRLRPWSILGLVLVPLLVAGVPWELVVLVPVPFAALFLGWLPHH